MSVDVVALLKVRATCEDQDDEPLISLVFPTPDGSSGQIFLSWKQGRFLRDYLKDPVLNGKLSLYQAARSRIVDHNNVKRRLTYIPQPGDELRIIRTTPIE